MKLYLGDSVYAEWETRWDATYLKLTTNNGYPDDPRNVILLEPAVVSALMRYIEKGP